MSLMLPRAIVLCDVTAGLPVVPRRLRATRADGSDEDADEDAYDYTEPLVDGDGLVLRIPGMVVAFHPIVGVGARRLFVAYANGARGAARTRLERYAKALIAAGVIRDFWRLVESDGAWVSPELEADSSARAVAVKGRWPTAWRVRLPGDSLGTIDTPPAAPTGPRCLGVVLA
jgi:hypothetical protein